MSIGNELYAKLSRSARQSFLMFTELPAELTVFDTDYILEYSQSYSGILYWLDTALLMGFSTVYHFTEHLSCF